MFRRTRDEQDSITRTWAEVEAAVGSLRGRKFYGAFDPETNEYRVCVQWQDGDDASALDLEDGAIAGGPLRPRATRRPAASHLRTYQADHGALGAQAGQRPVAVRCRVLPPPRPDRPTRSGQIGLRSGSSIRGVGGA